MKTESFLIGKYIKWENIFDTMPYKKNIVILINGFFHYLHLKREINFKETHIANSSVGLVISVLFLEKNNKSSSIIYVTIFCYFLK